MTADDAISYAFVRRARVGTIQTASSAVTTRHQMVPKRKFSVTKNERETVAISHRDEHFRGMELKRGRGRPSTFTEETAAEIVARLSDGEPLAAICRDEEMPDRTTVYDWMEKIPTFSLQIARGRNEGYDAIAVRSRETIRGQGESTGDVIRDKAIIEHDLKLLAKWDPKRYGDRRVIAGDPDAPLNASRNVVDLDALTAEQRLALREIMLIAASDRATVIEGVSREDDE